MICKCGHEKEEHFDRPWSTGCAADGSHGVGQCYCASYIGKGDAR